MPPPANRIVTRDVAFFVNGYPPTAPADDSAGAVSTAGLSVFSIAGTGTSLSRPRAETLSRIPTPTKLMTIDDPPDDTNGSAMPFVGIEAVTTATCISAWIAIITVTPNASNAPRSPRAGEAARWRRQR